MADRQEPNERQDEKEEEERIRQAIRDLAAGGKVTCRDLLELAQRTDASPGRVGKLCDEMGLRVAACQLGCFR